MGLSSSLGHHHFGGCLHFWGRPHFEVIKIFEVVFIFELMSLSFKSYKDPSFVWGDIYKMICIFVKSLIFNVYCIILQIGTFKKALLLSDCGFPFWKLVLKMALSLWNENTSPMSYFFLWLSHKHITFNTVRRTPCIIIHTS